MGAKSPDILVPPPSPLTALTLAEMHVRGWQLKATCDRCPTKLRVSLPAMIRTYGPDAVWWGHKPRCPGLECERGVLTYAARALRTGSWVAMSSHPGKVELEAHRRRKAQSREPR
jgi:hypothetical protein